ncbi:SHOCT domain-containing protein ['Paenibacillus yunnanensis' Narsing Rao et al. 2020]|uniref:SHOCT domain-containing protein n=1 Tax=Paenibacillus tengchongensis TaxID=2608684 RepID=UPI00124E6E85|nr:SHOCT domain-containing protein [Paenibacillus tengchongensis]
MNIKRVMIVGTMVVAMSFGGTAWARTVVLAAPVAKWSISSVDGSDALLAALKQRSDEELYEALYDGKSLKEIAEENGGDIESVINLQTAELQEQLDERLASGSISQQQYEAQRAELREIVAASVHTSFSV